MDIYSTIKYMVVIETEIEGHVMVRSKVYFLIPFFGGKLLLAVWTQFLQTKWGDPTGCEIVSRRPEK